MNCVICGKEFIAHRKDHKCCSKSCSDKNYRQNHVKEHSEYVRQWRKLHSEKAKEYNKTYFERHPEMRLKHIRDHNKKWREDPLKNVIQNQRKHIAQRCNSLKANKLFKYKELLGCDGKTFKDHIESKFVNGMSWENYGKDGWHIDHIKRLADHNLTNPIEQKQAFHYTNLQPMWKKDHLGKTAKENKEWRWKK